MKVEPVFGSQFDCRERLPLDSGSSNETARVARDLLDRPRRRELEAAEASITIDTGLGHRPLDEGVTVAGVYRQRLDLASGRLAMIDDGLGFSLVPWIPSLERHLGHQVSGISRTGRIELNRT